MTWPHAFSFERRVPLRPDQHQPFEFPDLVRVKRKAASARSRSKRGLQHDIELDELRRARLKYEIDDGRLAFNGYRQQLEMADQRLMRRVALSILSARQAQAEGA